MNYTDSLDRVIHLPTGQPMHTDKAATCTVQSAKDTNMPIWSLMELVKAAGFAGRPFNPDDPGTYTLLKRAIDAIYAPLKSPEFTGVPKVPTPNQGDKSKQAVNSEFVTLALADKAIGEGFNMEWAGLEGQPPWVLGGPDPARIKVYDPRNFHVSKADDAEHAGDARYATNAGYADGTGYAVYADNAGNAGFATNAGNADTLGGIPMRHQENPGQPYYLYGRSGDAAEITLFTRSWLAVGSADFATTATYAHQLTGPGLVGGNVGSYLLNKNHTTSEAAGAWELRGFAYDYGSFNDGQLGSRAALWQRVG
ncbi:hypothetical protein [Collimonas antrihumi]|uniref:hypothetical protein n=1 Tax=Collimonas antrihumi TaxID=1940615 RepID=UPI001B8C6EA3|nr:hypothetical protein [Collimonas antrihumi]